MVWRSHSALRFWTLFGIISLALSACGGGGGSGGSGTPGGGGTGGGAPGNGAGNQTPSTPDPPSKIVVTESNVVDLAAIALVRAEYLQLNAELMISATLVAQVAEDGMLTSTCPTTSGTLTLEHMDLDSDSVLSPGDRVRLVYADCEGVSGTIALDVTSVAQTGATLDRLTGVISEDLLLSSDDFELSLQGSQSIDYSVDVERIAWATANGSVTTSADDITFAIRDTSISYTVEIDANAYELSLAGTATSLGADYAFGTVEPFTGSRGSYPAQGYLDLIAEDSAGRILNGGDAAPYPTWARYQVDETGDGEFGPTTFTPWDAMFLGAMFALADSDSFLPIPGVWDLTSRRTYLGGVSSDVVMDHSRDQLYVSITDRNEIAVVDADSLLVTDRIPVGAGPEGLWLGADGETLYVALSQSGAIAALNLDMRTVEYINVAAALGNPMAFDVVEVIPGVLFVAGNPGPGGIGYVVKVDRNAGDIVTRVADETLLRDRPALAADPDGEFVIAGDESRLLKIDVTDPAGPVVLERATSAGRNLSLSADGNRLYLRSGEIIDTSDFGDLGTLEAGVPYALRSGLEVLIGRSDFQLSIYDAQTRIHIDRLTTKCGLDGEMNTLIPYGTPGRWMMLADLGFCAVDFYNPGEAPGSDSPNPPVGDLEPVPVPSETFVIGSGIGDIEYDDVRNRLYVSDTFENRIHSLDADTFDVVETFDLDGKAIGIDLNPQRTRLAIAIRDAVPLAILDLATGAVEYIDVSDALGRSVASDVSFVADDAIFVSGDTGDAYIVRAYANGDAAIRIGNEELISTNAIQVADPLGQRLYVFEWHPHTVYALDIGQDAAPVVTSVVLEEDPFGNQISLSPDGSSLAVSQGLVFRTSDLTQSGQAEEGNPVFTADGSALVVVRGDQKVHVFDPASFTKRMIVDPGCDVGTPARLYQFGGKNDWAQVVGSRICRFSLPVAGAQQQKTQLPSYSKVSASYDCDSDCISRRIVRPRFSSAVTRDYSRLVPR